MFLEKQSELAFSQYSYILDFDIVKIYIKDIISELRNIFGIEVDSFDCQVMCHNSDWS